MRKGVLFLVVAILAAIVSTRRILQVFKTALSGEIAGEAWLGHSRLSDGPNPGRGPSLPTFVGAKACGGCHRTELKLWEHSHHKLAMQPANQVTALGDFNNTKVSHGGVTSIFFRRGNRLIIRTDGPDGALRDYEIKFTFGVAPLQQYLIEMPGGRLQVLGISWDNRPREQGGQRWFVLRPDQTLRAGDALHWTGIDQNWNFMCADCHSTNVRKNYDPGSRTFSTSYAEINVACEACHGPGSNHVSWAKRASGWQSFNLTHGLTIALGERQGVTWSINPATGQPRRSSQRASEYEIQMCARCHSRRSQLHQDYVHGQPVGDDYRVSLLDPNLYFPDGQIKDEVYEYGSFIQSRMFHAGVTCGDCHEPHSSLPRAQGNRLCAQCHAPRYDSPKHHFHHVGSAGAQCVNCHMPARVYMVVDERRDHSMRIPRPDLSIDLGVPNACNQCHAQRSAKWAAGWVEKWYGRKSNGFQQFARSLKLGADGAPDALSALVELATNKEQPPIARAEALSMVKAYRTSAVTSVVKDAVSDESGLVRRAAADALSNSDQPYRMEILTPLVDDPVRAVRLEAAAVLAGTRPDEFSDNGRFAKVIDEYIAAQELNADRPEAHLNLGLLYAKENHPDRAAAEFKAALIIDPSFEPAAVNLADLYREQNHDELGEEVLQRAIRKSPTGASLQHSLGLLMIRQNRRPQALELFANAARLAPAVAHYTYVYALALEDAGQAHEAIEALKASIKIHPYDRESLELMSKLLDAAGDTGQARVYGERLQLLEERP